METLTIIVDKDFHNQRVDKFLSSHFPSLTRTRIQSLINEHQLTQDGKVILSASCKVKEGERYILAVPPAADAHPQPEPIPLDIIYEDADLLVLNKPAGMVVHPAPGNRGSTLVNALLAHCGESLSGIGGVRRPGIVHRLDKETSGLMVVAKNDFTHQGLSHQFARRTLSRNYWAFVWSAPYPKEGIIEGDIGRSPHNRQKMAVVTRNGKPAATAYNLCKRFFAKEDVSQVISMICCHLQTGRTHQIRVHLAHIGHPLVGDPVYGRTPKRAKQAFDDFILTFPRQALHAFELTFIHPRSKETMVFKAPLPLDLERLQACLEGTHDYGDKL